MSRSALRSSGRVASASCSRRSPALVKRIGLVLRTNSGRRALFQLLELVRQRRLGQVQALGSLHQAVGLAQGMKGFQVTDLQHS